MTEKGTAWIPAEVSNWNAFIICNPISDAIYSVHESNLFYLREVKNAQKKWPSIKR